MATISKSIFDASIARLRRKFPNPADAEEAVRAFSEGWTVVDDTASEPASADALSGRQHEYTRLVQSAIMNGVAADEAQRRARVALAVSHGEDPAIEDLTLDEARVAIAAREEAASEAEREARNAASWAEAVAEAEEFEARSPVGVSPERANLVAQRKRLEDDSVRWRTDRTAELLRKHPGTEWAPAAAAADFDYNAELRAIDTRIAQINASLAEDAVAPEA